MSVDDKIRVLKSKQLLKDCEEFSHTYLKGAKTHAERLIDHNFREILKEIPNGGRYRFTGSGRLVRSEVRNAEDGVLGQNAVSEGRQTRSPGTPTRGGVHLRGRGRGGRGRGGTP